MIIYEFHTKIGNEQENPANKRACKKQITNKTAHFMALFNWIPRADGFFLADFKLVAL